MRMFRTQNPGSLRVLAALMLLAVTVVAALSRPADAEVTREIDWGTLVPPAPEIEFPFKHLTRMQVLDLDELTSLRRALAAGDIAVGDPYHQDSVLLEKRFREDGLDPDALVTEFSAFMDKISVIETGVVEDLDGSLIRMPGYALPLEHSGTGVREILLVPYVGACIHTPPPPPNQVVFAKLDEPYVSKGLYDPVWITGRMRVVSSQSDLFYVDGRTIVDSGYTIEVERIEPYEE